MIVLKNATEIDVFIYKKKWNQFKANPFTNTCIYLQRWALSLDISVSLIVDSVELKDVGTDDISFESVHSIAPIARFLRINCLEHGLQSESRRKTNIDK